MSNLWQCERKQLTLKKAGSSKLPTYATPWGTWWAAEELTLDSRYIKWRSWSEGFFFHSLLVQKKWVWMLRDLFGTIHGIRTSLDVQHIMLNNTLTQDSFLCCTVRLSCLSNKEWAWNWWKKLHNSLIVDNWVSWICPQMQKVQLCLICKSETHTSE